MSEDQLQARMVRAFNRKYRDYRRLLCHNHNNGSSRQEQMRLKAMGLQTGRSDLVLYGGPGATVHVEVKRPGKRQGPEQVKWQAAVEWAGYPYYVVDNVEDFMDIMKKYLE